MKEELTKEEHGEERAFNPRDNSQPDEAGKKAMAGRKRRAVAPGLGVREIQSEKTRIQREIQWGAKYSAMIINIAVVSSHPCASCIYKASSKIFRHNRAV